MGWGLEDAESLEHGNGKSRGVGRNGEKSGWVGLSERRDFIGRHENSAEVAQEKRKEKDEHTKVTPPSRWCATTGMCGWTKIIAIITPKKCEKKYVVV
jgi:hypothetical protein